MNRWSLTRRLVVILTLGALMAWMIGALLAANSLRLGLDAAFDGGLQETAERILPLALDGLRDRDHDHVHEPTGGREVPLLHEGAEEYLIYQIRGADGTVMLRSHDAPELPFDSTPSPGFSNVGPWRVFTGVSPQGDFYIQVAEANSHRAAALLSSFWALLWPIALLLPLSAVGIGLAVRGGLKPVQRLSEELGDRHGANLTAVDTSRLPKEVLPVGMAVNQLIARLSVALEAERDFAANSAHEMRTPIAGSLAQTQRLLAEIGPGPARDRALHIESSLLRLRHLSEKLLQLSRAEAGLGAAETAVDLLPALRLLIEDFDRSHPGQVELSIAAAADLDVAMDVDAFGIVMRNLLENADLYGGGGLIRVRVATGVVEVSNGGPAVPADKLSQLAKRFVRASSDQQGSGLGLSIVESLMRQSGGRLELVSPLPGQPDGFAAQLFLPTSSNKGPTD